MCYLKNSPPSFSQLSAVQTTLPRRCWNPRDQISFDGGESSPSFALPSARSSARGLLLFFLRPRAAAAAVRSIRQRSSIHPPALRLHRVARTHRHPRRRWRSPSPVRRSSPPLPVPSSVPSPRAAAAARAFPQISAAPASPRPGRHAHAPGGRAGDTPPGDKRSSILPSPPRRLPRIPAPPSARPRAPQLPARQPRAGGRAGKIPARYPPPAARKQISTHNPRDAHTLSTAAPPPGFQYHLPIFNILSQK